MHPLLSKYNIDLLPKPNEYHLLLDEKLPPLDLVTAALGLIFEGDRFLMIKLNSRGWDIPGGHIEAGESPVDAVRREVYEETAVAIDQLQLFAHEKFVIHAPQPPGYKYPHPISYQLFYLGHVTTLDPFQTTGEVAERRLFTPAEVQQTDWGNRNAVLYQAALAAISFT